ncbi:MAG: hypothetical protein M3Z66_19625, partial [Chloroflexota bacterium]|nr:hypothetical protein [Chloroflexota bacterium]
MIRKLRLPLVLATLGASVLLPATSHPVFAATYTVTTTADSGPGSLRQAITDVNTAGQYSSSANTIDFSIGGATCSSPAPVYTIQPASALPAIQANLTLIDGYSQCGAEANSNALSAGSNAQIKIQLDGALAGANANGLMVGHNSTVRGLSITRFAGYGLENSPTGYYNSFGFSANATFDGNFLGLTPDGVAAGNGAGIGLSYYQYSRVLVGTPSGASYQPASANVISGNTTDGIDANGYLDTISGNYIGTNPTGTAARANGGSGVSMVPGTSSVNTGATLDNNVISGNTGDGVTVGQFTDCNICLPPSGAILSNLIGTNAMGTGAMPNGGNGVTVQVSAHASIGGSAQGNIIAYNTGQGIQIGSGAGDPAKSKISANSIFQNAGLGISLAGQVPSACTTGPTAGAPNGYTPCPVLASGGNSSVTGTACTGCTVEVFIATNPLTETDDQNHGEGQTYLGSVTAGACSSAPCSGTSAFTLSGSCTGSVCTYPSGAT